MKMTTKVFTLVVVALLVLGVVGCKGGGKEKKTEDAAAETTSVEAEAGDYTKQEVPAPQEQTQSAPPQEEVAPSTAEDEGETLIREEFKEAMDSYEAFFDEYVEFMKRYQDDPTNAELMLELSEMTSKEAKMLKEFNEWGESDGMTVAETAYYLEVNARIEAKLAEII